MISSVLIANRGEIACRIARTARRLGIRVIAVFSEADRDAPFVRMADNAVEIGPAPAARSYLDAGRILEAARKTGAEAIHPGYGFLSENAAFAEAVIEAGMTFVGPPAAAVRAMGLKDEAKSLMQAAGVPVLPGHAGKRQDAASLARAGRAVGYPLMIKAVAGGGGKGMRRVDAEDEFAEALAACQREATGAFGDRRVLLERCIDRPRHIEVQVFADRHGNVVHLFERDCSLQRRHQKVVEESPAPGLAAPLRQAMTAAAVRAARAIRYEGAGTVEFIVSTGALGEADEFWFMEMNTRLQVEHPVTEMVTGIDLVEWQFLVASGMPLPRGQEDIRTQGHAVEARLYAEDPVNGFLPQSGRLHRLAWPEDEGLRIDTGVEQGSAVTPHYDPMIAKLIAHASTRDMALERLATALDRTTVLGLATNRPFLAALLRQSGVRAGRVDTGLIGRELSSLAVCDGALVAAGVLAFVWPMENAAPGLAFDGLRGWSLLGFERVDHVAILVNGQPADAELVWCRDGRQRVTVGGRTLWASSVAWSGNAFSFEADGHRVEVETLRAGDHLYVAGDSGHVDIARRPLGGQGRVGVQGENIVRSPMPGRVGKVFAAKGQPVRAGDRLVILEAMKMEHLLAAPVAGVVSAVEVEDGDQVEEGRVLLEIAPAAEAESGPV